MVPALSSTAPVVQPTTTACVRVLTWTYRREDETIGCRLALTADHSAYELRIEPPWNPTGASIELFDDALSALERQATIERCLIKSGFALEQFDSASEARRSASTR